MLRCRVRRRSRSIAVQAWPAVFIGFNGGRFMAQRVKFAALQATM
jgi:hypothetical protein